MTLKVAVSSSRFDRSPESLRASTTRILQAYDVVVLTEVGRDTRAGVLDDIPGVHVAHVNGARGADECAIVSRHPIDNVAVDVLTERLTSDRGRNLIQAVRCDVLVDDQRIRVSGVHHAAHIEGASGFRGGTDTACFKDAAATHYRMARAWSANGDLDGVVLAGDYNLDWRKRWVRDWTARTMPQLRCAWTGHLPASGGTHRGGRVIDWVLTDLAVTDARLLRDDDSSDHRPMGATLALPTTVSEKEPSMDRFIPKEQWGANPTKEATEDSHPIGATDGITAHWEGTHVPVELHADCAERVRNIERAHEYGRGWGDIAYNLLVCQHGFVFEGRGAGVRSAANGYTAANESHYAVCYLGGPTGVGFTSEGREGFLWAFGYLAREGDAGPERNGHKDHKATQCPGPDIYRWVSTLPPGAGTTTTEEDWLTMATAEEVRAIVAEEIDKALSAGQANDRSVRQNVRIGANARDLAAANGKALAALSEGFDERIRDNVKAALAEGVVDVEVTVTDRTDQEA